MRNDFNPFGKSLNDLDADDLSILETVSEGWYVEYKREVPNAASIAKSITAFANTYGGWLFYGIGESSKEQSFAGEFIGIARSDLDQSMQRIRQAVANHSQPSPFFEMRPIFGECVPIGLKEERAVIAIWVPWGPDAPYVHKDARIYRRVGDGSEPKPEHDRFVLDQLWKRSDAVFARHREWTEQDLEISEGEERGAYLRIFLFPDFWGDRGVKGLPLRRIRELLRDRADAYSVPFDAVYEVPDGIVARQTRSNDPELRTLTWKIGRDLRCDIIIPLLKTQEDLAVLKDVLSRYELASDFIGLCQKQGYDSPTVIDLNQVFPLTLGFMQAYKDILQETRSTGTVFAKVKVTGVWRSIPFLDIPVVIRGFELHGVPLTLTDELTIWPGHGREGYHALPEHKGEEAEAFPTIAAVTLLIIVARAMGISFVAEDDPESERFADHITDALEAGKRSMLLSE